MKNRTWIYKGIITTKNIFGRNKHVHKYEHKTTKEIKTTNLKTYLK